MATKVISHEKGSFVTDVKEIRRRAASANYGRCSDGGLQG
jgi:hypothetical protein